MTAIDYYLQTTSPWTYFGHDRVATLARRLGVPLNLKPVDLPGRIFPSTGGLPLHQRPAARQAYRLVELKRWSRVLRMPLNLEPKHFPAALADSSRMIILADACARNGTTSDTSRAPDWSGTSACARSAAPSGSSDAAIRFAGRILEAVWVHDQDIADPATVIALADECGLDGASLHARVGEADATFDRFNDEALAAGVFGAPWYVVDGEPFWGQDRIDLLESHLVERLSAGTDAT